MNIKEAKQEIINTVKAYLTKDETGTYEIPPEKQRPILLMGPPGIGKTAVMEQAAAECGINLVSYTITHHTRQSAIGLPFISKRVFGGTEYSVTEYTMSEIIASVYEQIERSGIREGILFLDEINCVSETLAPTMLQFLQYKMFGTHRVPDGFLIVTAGNPPEYNKSVRELDIVTLDRVKRIDVEADFGAWKEYAIGAGVHGSILSYLEIRQEHFYQVREGLDGRSFVTARGWEDLSRVIQVYEKTGQPVTENLVKQYLQSPEIAADYAAYYELYNLYYRQFRIEEILAGNAVAPERDFRSAPFDEKLSLIGLLTDRLNRDFRTFCIDEDVQKSLFGELKLLLKTEHADVSALRARLQESLEDAGKARIAGAEEMRIMRYVLHSVKDLERAAASVPPGNERKQFVKEWFAERETARKQRAEETGERLTHAFDFLEKTFGESQEMVIFLTELSAGRHSLRYLSECGNKAYFHFNRILLLKDRQEQLKTEVMSLLDGSV